MILEFIGLMRFVSALTKTREIIGGFDGRDDGVRGVDRI